MTKPKSRKISEKSKKLNTKKTFKSFKIGEQNTILALIFEQMEFKHLLKVNTVSKRWNKAIDPIIRKSLRLVRVRYMEKEYHDADLSREDKFNLEVEECINNNEKYSKLVHNFKWNAHLSNDITIEFFTKFNNITNLTVYNLKVSQDLILTAINLLKKLTILKLENITVKQIFKKRILTNNIKLPDTLTKLELIGVKLIGSPDLFVDSINSHKRIADFGFRTDSDKVLLEPFLKNYSTLKTFKFNVVSWKSNDEGLKIAESNPQLKVLHFHSPSINQNTLQNINALTNLEELVIREITRVCNVGEIKSKLGFQHLKKLTIYLTTLSTKNFKDLIAYSNNIKELHVALGNDNWKEWIKIIRENCSKLTNLTYHIPRQNNTAEGPLIKAEDFFDEFVLHDHKSKQTLQSLSLSNLPLLKFLPSHFDGFPKLTIINFREYTSYLGDDGVKEIKEHFKGFGEFKLKGLKNRWASEGYLTKSNNRLSPLNWEEFDRW